MRNRNILITVGLILLVSLSGCNIDSSDENVIKVDNPEQQLPKDIEFYDYIVDIEDTWYYDNYVIAKYTIRTKDDSPINEKKIHLAIPVKSNTIVYGIGGRPITKRKSENELEIIYPIFIIENLKNNIELTYSLHGLDNLSSKEDLDLDNIYSFDKTNKNYTIINSKKNIDNMNITIDSLGDFDFGSFFNLYIEYAEDYTELDTDKYQIKFVSGDYNNIYNINSIIGYKEEYMEDLKSYGDYDEDTKVIQFFYSYLDYDHDLIDLDDFQIYLVNNDTKEETLLYSK